MSLRKQLITAVVLFLSAVTVVVTAFTVISNERAEKFTWSTMLNFELDRIESTHASPTASLVSPNRTDAAINRIVYYRADDGSGIPAPFNQLTVGVHDDLDVDGRLFAALVRGDGQARRVVAVDVSSVEAKEKTLARQVLLTILSLMILLGALALWGLQRFLNPLRKLSDDIATLVPSDIAQGLTPIPNATSEIKTITAAINGYVERNLEFLARERAFINTASHELRTPIAVLRNNLQLAHTELSTGKNVASRLERSEAIAKEMQELLDVLLILARDPQKLTATRQEFDLTELVEHVAAQHSHMLALRELRIDVVGERVFVEAPLKMAQIALSNVVRNAVENSDRGLIRIEVSVPGEVRVTDPGHGMSPQEISGLYAKAARGASGDRQLGIGLQLLARICTHLGWTLEFSENMDGQTQARLLFPTVKKLG